MIQNKQVYERIKQIRKALGMSQTELAIAVGYADKTMISHIENGKIDLSATKLEEIAKTLGVTPGYLMGWEDDGIPTVIRKYTSNQPEASADVAKALELYEKYQSAIPEVRAAVETLLKSVPKKS